MECEYKAATLPDALVGCRQYRQAASVLQCCLRSQMLGFDGSSKSKQKPVNLGGRSLKQGAVVETKQQLAERNAKVRTQREQQRANNSASSCISLAWRVRRARCAAKSRVQEVAEHALNHFSPITGGSVAACAPHDGEPLPPPVADSSARAFRCCCSAYMFLRRSSLLDRSSALYVTSFLHCLFVTLWKVPAAAPRAAFVSGSRVFL